MFIRHDDHASMVTFYKEWADEGRNQIILEDDVAFANKRFITFDPFYT